VCESEREREREREGERERERETHQNRALIWRHHRVCERVCVREEGIESQKQWESKRVRE